MLTLVLADSELELVPPQIQRHPAVRSYARKRGASPAKILLDSSFHHPALKGIEQGERRGRPDIVHLFLLLCLDSMLNLEGKLRTIVHTRNDEVLTVRPDTRIPKNYVRFVGLIEDLFEKGRVPEGDTPLLTLDKGKNLATVLGEVGGTRIAFDPEGKRVDLYDLVSGKRSDLTIIIGGFPHGGFNSPVKDLCDEFVSIHETPLKVWTVTSEVLAGYRHGLIKKRPARK